ncbi:MAG: excinuclease ABC subunit UvrA [Polyangiaceae bacterium]
MELDHIIVTGAREHNLKAVTVRFPKKKLVVFSGVSGSGKSSLAFDTLYAEGQRRYVESLSAYARQFLGRLDKPKFDTIRGLAPAVSIEQKATNVNPRSTVGTITEIADYLRVLYARVGTQHCPQCDRPVLGQTPERICETLLAEAAGQSVTLLARVLENRKGEHRELLAGLRSDGHVRVRLDGEILRLEQLEALEKRKKHDLDVVVDRLRVEASSRGRLAESVERALSLGQGTLRALVGGDERLFSRDNSCLHCRISFSALTPQAFSFNSPQGMCPECHGLGTLSTIDPDRVVVDKSLTIDEGAIVVWGEDASKKKGWAHGFRGQILTHLKIPADRPFRKLTQRQQEILFWGTGDKRYTVIWKAQKGSGSGKFEVTWEGLIPRLTRRFSSTTSERAKRWYARFMGDAPCRSCGGARLRAESAAVRVGDKSLVDVGALTVSDAVAFFAALELRGASQEIASEVLKEVRARLGFLEAVGLGYLSLDRPGPSLSGGEAQRIRLASQVGSELTGVLYILDEPSIGLHQRDNQRLIDTLLRLRDIGNSVVVVEHDEDTLRAADWVVDFGPGAGVHGGEVVFTGTPRQLQSAKASLTGQYLSGRETISTPEARRPPSGWVTVEGAAANNLKDIDVPLPLGVLVAVTGVSGAGKSTLVNDILVPALARSEEARPAAHRGIEGSEQVERVILVDQRPIGRTPRSNPATYVKAFDEIRNLFAELPDARMRGMKPGRFSFNVKGGRCEACEGDGVRKVEMHFLADVYVRCDECQGRRFNEATLAVRYRDKSIAEVLDLTIDEAREIFAAHPKIRAPLDLLSEVGVGYLHLGQPSPTLSGGEAQRIKLARELGKRTQPGTLYVLDEPTTGLHFHDVKKLLVVLHRLVDAGNTVIVVEHNLDVIKNADFVVDLGPEGGPAGGRLVASGTPEQVAKSAASHTGRFLRGALKLKAPARAKQGSRPRRANGAARAMVRN